MRACYDLRACYEPCDRACYEPDRACYDLRACYEPDRACYEPCAHHHVIIWWF